MILIAAAVANSFSLLLQVLLEMMSPQRFYVSAPEIISFVVETTKVSNTM